MRNLFRCTPNDLIEWEPSPEQAAVENHPLKPLEMGQKGGGPHPTATRLLDVLLEEIESLIKERYNTAKVSTKMHSTGRNGRDKSMPCLYHLIIASSALLLSYVVGNMVHRTCFWQRINGNLYRI